MSRHQDFLACHAAGMTVPEAAAHLGVHQTGIYRWAQRQGLRFANRKRPPPPNGQMPPDAEAKRRAAHAAAMAKLRDREINGWSWAALMDAGFTAPQAARLRGQTIAAAYMAEQVLGRRFYRVHLHDLTPVERRKMHRIRRDYGVDRDTALTSDCPYEVMQQALGAVRNDYSLARMYAMGVDAWSLANHFSQMRQVQGFEINGNTGALTATPDCVINRKLSWLKYQQGQVVPAS